MNKLNKFLQQNGYYINISYITDQKISVDIGKAFTKSKRSNSFIVESGDDGFTRLFTKTKSGQKQILIVQNCGVNILDDCIKKLIDKAQSESNIDVKSYVTISK